MKRVFKAIKATKRNCLVSVAPNPQRFSYESFLADWEKWERMGLIEELVLQIYRDDMRWAAGWLGPWLPLNLGHDLTMIVDEFGTKLFEEIDYINEARNAEKFANNFRDHPQVKVPLIYWRYTNTRVLTLEWINGFKLTETKSIREVGLDPETIIQIGVTAGLQQLLEHGFFHDRLIITP